MVNNSLKNAYLVEMNNITKTFPGVVALDSVDFKVKKGSIHALVGENGAGKSTLMKILAGLYQADNGEILINNEKVHIRSSNDALNNGISMIHQELEPVPYMSIAENIFLGREPETKIKGFVNFRKLYKDTQVILKEYGYKYDPKTKLSNLSVSDTQMIEIIKAISYNASLIIMDEPTSALTEAEVDRLFSKVKELKSKGISTIFITHRLDEIFKIVDEITILRDGKLIHTDKLSNLNKEKIISLMVGRELNNLFPKEDVEMGDVLFEVRNLNQRKKLFNIDLKLKKGEIVGISGLMGAGRTELARAIFGLDKFDSGEIFIEGKRIRVRSPKDAIKNGIVMLSEDRKMYGLVLCRSLLENIALPNLDYFSKTAFLNLKKEYKESQKIFKNLNIKAPTITTVTNSLSGGNQQKVVVGKWLLAKPKVIILDEPTRGIDVGSKYEIYKIMGNLAKQGIGIIMISSELPEILGISDRIVVMSNGRITGEILGKNASQEKIMELAIGGQA